MAPILEQIDEMVQLLYDAAAIPKEQLQIHMSADTMELLREEIKAKGFTLVPLTGPLEPQLHGMPIVINDKAPKGRIFLLQRGDAERIQ